jgi:hypothetical protein
MESQFGGNSGDVNPGTNLPPGIKLPPGITSPTPAPNPGEPEPEHSADPASSAAVPVEPESQTAETSVPGYGPVPPPVFTAPIPPTGSIVGGTPGADYVTGWQTPAKKKGPSRTWIALAVAFCVALVAGILVFVTGGGSTTASMQPAALVQASAQKTLSEGTADLKLSGSVSAEGLNIPLTGTGEMNFVHPAGLLNIQMSVDGQSALVQEIFVGGVYYEQTSEAVDGGTAKWIAIPLPETSGGVALGQGSDDPVGAVQLLAQKGASVKKIGTETIDGVQTTEYSVVPSKEQMVKEIKQELASVKLPAAIKQQLETYEQSPPKISLNVWIDASGLLRRLDESLSLGLSGSSGNVSGNIVMTFDSYGAQVNIKAPPPGDVESLSQATNSSVDRAAQSNLINALTEGKALYEINQAYGSDARAYGSSSFTAQAPEFTWTPGSCRASAANCISFAVLDVSARGDHQGLALAVYGTSGTCWYAVDVESTPDPITGDSSAIWSVAGGGSNSSLKAGDWYATSPEGVSESSCSASTVLHPSGHVGWAQSLSSAGSLG